MFRGCRPKAVLQLPVVDGLKQTDIGYEQFKRLQKNILGVEIAPYL